MRAVAVEQHGTDVEVPGRVELPVAPVGADEVVDERQIRAEHTFWRRATIGAAIGMVAGAGGWALLVFLALAGSDWDLGPALLMGAAVGVFAGAFLGGWAGVMTGCGVLEAAEHAQRHDRAG